MEAHANANLARHGIVANGPVRKGVYGFVQTLLLVYIFYEPLGTMS